MRCVSMLLLSVAIGVQASSSLAAGCVALTFDDGPDRSLTPRVLDILRDERVRATFYLVGSRAAANPGIVRAIADGGHEIGNHSWSHPNLTGLSATAVASQIDRTDDAIRNITGRRPATFRPPYGAWNGRVAAAIDGRPLVMWDVDTQDWRNRNAARITQVSARAHSGSVILMHDIHASTVAALPGVIRELKAEGMRFVRVSDVGGCGPTVAFPTTRPRGTEIREAALDTSGNGWLMRLGGDADFRDRPQGDRDLAPRAERRRGDGPILAAFTDPAWTGNEFAMSRSAPAAERPARQARAERARDEQPAREARAERRRAEPPAREARTDRRNDQAGREMRTARMGEGQPQRERSEPGFRWGSPNWSDYQRNRDFQPAGVRAGGPSWTNVRADRETRERLARLQRDPRAVAQIEAIHRDQGRAEPAATATARYADTRSASWQ